MKLSRSHDDDNTPGQVNIAVFALALGILVWRTGGLEAAIALHVVNNVVILIGDTIGLTEPTTHAVSAAAFWSSNVIVITFTVLALVCHRVISRRDLRLAAVAGG